MEVERPLLERKRDLDYVNLHGLNLLTGCDPEDLDRFLIKELVDNALDACSENAEVKITVAIENLEDEIKIVVDDNGKMLSEKDIYKITDFERSYSSTFHFKYPTRGKLGSALKCIMGVPYAFVTRSNSPLEIVSGNMHYDVSLEIDKLNQMVRSKVFGRNREGYLQGTRFQVSVPKYREEWGTKARYLEMLLSYAVLNAEVSFSYYGMSVPSIVKRFRGFRGGSSIHWYDLNEFKDLVYATRRELLRNTETCTVRNWVKRFRGLSSDRKLKGLLQQFDDVENLNDLQSDEEIKTLYHLMKERSPDPDPQVLGPLGKRNILTRLTQMFGAPEHFSYKRIKDIHYEAGVSIPYILEIAMAIYDADDLKRRVIISGINRSPCMQNPFSGWFYTWTDEKGRTEEFDFGSVLHKNKIDYETPVIFVIHLICPNVKYHSYGKTRIYLEPFMYGFARFFTKMCKSYRRLKGKKRLKSQMSVALLKREIARRLLLRRQNNGVIPPDELTTQNGLYYKIRKFMAGDIGMKRQAFITSIRRVCSELGVTREDVGIFASVRAELYFDDKVYPISAKSIEDLANKGCDIVLVEKEGICRVLAPYAYKRGIALVNSRGFVVEYAKELLKLSKLRKGNIFLLTDYDASGLLIGQNLLMQIPRLGIGSETFVKLGISRSEVEEKYDTSDGLAPEKHLGALLPSLQAEVERTRVEIDAVLNAVGVERFWNYLEDEILRYAPKRDLTRSLDLSIRLPTQIKEPMEILTKFVESVGQPRMDELAEDMKEWNEGLVHVKEKQEEIQGEVEKEILENKAVQRLIERLRHISEDCQKL